MTRKPALVHRITRLLFLFFPLLALFVPVRAQAPGTVILVVAPYTTASDRELAQSLPWTPLAQMTWGDEGWLIAAAPAASRQTWTKIDHPVIEIAVLTEKGMGFYLVEQPQSDRPGFQEVDLGTYGAIPWRQGPYTLLQTTPSQAAILSRMGVRITPLDTPIRLTSRPGFLPDPPASPNPEITSQIAQLLPANIASWNDRLSGEEMVTIGDQEYRLSSRYSWSKSGRRAERFIYEKLREMGYSPTYYPFSTPYGNEGWRNVTFDIPGHGDPDRLILLVGHLDSIAYPLSTAARAAPGADDNGSGSAALLAIAQLLQGQRFHHTLRLVWFMGEEQGYWGSRPYVSALAAADTDIMAVINLDMIGYDGDSDRLIELHSGDQAASQQLGTYLRTISDLYQLELHIEEKIEHATRFSDHRSFWEQGYPAVLLLENFFGEQDTPEDLTPRDRNPEYHSGGDVNSLVDFDYVTATARLALAAALHLANPVPLPPTPTPTSTSTQTPTITPTSTLTPTPQPGECRELVVNGSFEEETGWTRPVTPHQAVYTTMAAWDGNRSLLTGIEVGAANTHTYSSAHQFLALPLAATQIQLRFAVQGADADEGDRSEVILFTEDWKVLRLIWREGLQGGPWQHHASDLTPYRGQQVGLYLNTFNQGEGTAAWATFDAVSILACSSTAEPGTPTATPTPTASPPPPGPYRHHLPLLIRPQP